MAKLCSHCGKMTLLDAYFLPDNTSVCKNCYEEYLYSEWLKKEDRVSLSNTKNTDDNYYEINKSDKNDDFDTWLDKRLKKIHKI